MNIKPIAFYLPQFHTIPENDKWWGKGFTEWTNVKKTKPLFRGHNQPRIPHDDIGYYDLSNIKVMEKQAEMAKEYGIYGFCVYHYFFKDGKRLLEKPMENLLKHPEIDFPFCLCWANEPWSRRWDGSEKDVLMPQEHSNENDMNFIKSLKPYFQDQRYICINNRPLLIIYKANLFSNIKETIAKWRKWCLENDIGEIVIAKVISSNNYSDGIKEGFDYSVEFPPHNILINKPDTRAIRAKGFSYKKFVEHIFQNKTVKKKHKINNAFPGITLEWDNSARTGKRAVVLINFSVKYYSLWLRHSIKDVLARFGEGERFIFINAWNEWAEGTYLEPDKKNGYKALETTKRVLEGKDKTLFFWRTFFKIKELLFFWKAPLIKVLRRFYRLVSFKRQIDD